MKKFLKNISFFVLLMACQNLLATNTTPFNLTATGTPADVNITLCLNGEGPLSCGNYTVSALVLTIATTIPNRTYPLAGIKVNTSGYTIANLGLDCNLISNGYCLFSASAEVTKTITLVAIGALQITPALLPPALLNTNYNETITASGGVAPYTYAITAGSLPNGLSLDASSGLLSGTPTTDGIYSFTVTASDSNASSGAKDYSILVTGSLPITPPSLPDATINIPYSETVTATSGITPYTYAITAGSLPTGLTLDTSTGLIAGTPSVSSLYTFVITATDAQSHTGSQAYSINVNPAALTSLTTSGGIPTGVGISLDTIWTGTSPAFETATSDSSAPGCASPVGSSTNNLNFLFGTAGQTDTGWNPGADPYGAGYELIDLCVRLCTDFNATACTNWIYVTGN